MMGPTEFKSTCPQNGLFKAARSPKFGKVPCQGT